MKVSFCTTCMGRLAHLKETLWKNLIDNEGFDQLEFVVLDYSSPDGLGEWISKHFSSLIANRRLVYARVENMSTYKPAHSKNLAHKIASGQILCNVDADNFTGPQFADYLWSTMSSDDSVFVRADGSKSHNSVNGRIALRSAQFYALGGYDERLSGWGYEDGDLIARAKGMGLKQKFIPLNSKFLEVVDHDDASRAAFMPLKDIWLTNSLNRGLSAASIHAGHLTANSHGGFGRGLVSTNFGEWRLI